MIQCDILAPHIFDEGMIRHDRGVLAESVILKHDFSVAVQLEQGASRIIQDKVAVGIQLTGSCTGEDIAADGVVCGDSAEIREPILAGTEFGTDVRTDAVRSGGVVARHNGVDQHQIIPAHIDAAHMNTGVVRDRGIDEGEGLPLGTRFKADGTCAVTVSCVCIIAVADITGDGTVDKNAV